MVNPKIEQSNRTNSLKIEPKKKRNQNKETEPKSNMFGLDLGCALQSRTESNKPNHWKCDLKLILRYYLILFFLQFTSSNVNLTL